ncbi:MAG: CapA family protein [Lachnospiraceae bacterium]|nr:CapA family protein [Lachnospiraceae bacterium]
MDSSRIERGVIILCALFLSLLAGCGLIDRAKEAVFPKEAQESQASEWDEEVPIIVINSEDIKVDVSVDSEENTGKGEEEAPEEFVYEEIYDDVNKIYSVETDDLSTAVLTFIGDISFAEGYSNMSELYKQGNGVLGVIAPEVIAGLNDSDIFMANNEFPYSNRGSAREGKMFTFRAKPESVKYLKDMGVDIVSLGNNHAYDYGADALSDTIDILNEARVPFVGAGKNIEEAMKPVYFRINGKTIAYTSATQIERTGNPDTKEATADTPGVLRTLDSSKMVSCIRTASENSDFVVVYVHWGSENTDLVEESQRKLAKDYVAAGADLVIGDHSHCLQGIDYVDGVPVFYSLGNFWFNSRTIDTGFARVTLDTSGETVSIREFEFVPCIQRGCHTWLSSESEKERILTYLQGISNYAEISSEGVITASSTNHNIQNGQNTSPSKEFVRTTPTPEDSAEEVPAVDPAMELLLQQQALQQALQLQEQEQN